MRLRLVANVPREQSKLDGLLANVCEHSRTLAFIERRAGQILEAHDLSRQCYLSKTGPAVYRSIFRFIHSLVYCIVVIFYRRIITEDMTRYLQRNPSCIY